MNIITLDAETYFDKAYSLDKMTTESYVRDPRFEAHGFAVRFPNGNIEWCTPTIFNLIDWSDTALLCHHAQFDGLILSHHFGIRPRYWLCTLAMGRVQLGNHLSLSLESLAKHFNLKPKSVPYDLFKGKHWHELDAFTQQQVADGACHDVELTWQLFNIVAQNFPPDEYPFIDNTIRMFTEPKLVGDINMLGELWQAEQQHKQQLLQQLGVTAKQLGSNDVFANMLRQLGVEPERKAGKKGPIYAFAKTDPFMQDLQDDEDENVRALVEARLEVKSTLEQTRSASLGWMASRGAMCVYLNHAGAHTLRDSGGDGLNWQNFTRGSKLGKSIKAPPGFLKVKVDKSQIECRILNYVARQEDVIERFRQKIDPYVGIASQFYGFEVTKAHEKERGTGKQLELSCGYGAGSSTIQHTARKGSYGPPVYLSLEDAERAKLLYRDTHPQVTALWGEAGRLIAALAGTTQEIIWRDVCAVRSNFIYGPDGSCLKYPELHYDEDEREWRYKNRHGYTKLYGGKLVENVIQWLARTAFKQDVVRIGQETGLWPSQREHDAGVWLIPNDANADATIAYLVEEMRRPPSWLPGIPLDAEAQTVGGSYG